MGFLGANNEVAINTTQKLVATADTSQQRPPRLCSQLMIEAQCLRILPNADTLLFHRAGRLVGLVSGLCKIHWIMWMLTCLSHKIIHCMVCMHSASLWSAFLASAHQGRALEQQNAQLHKYTLPLPEIYQKPLKQGHVFTPDTLDGTNAVLIIEVPSIYILTNVI